MSSRQRARRSRRRSSASEDFAELTLRAGEALREYPRGLGRDPFRVEVRMATPVAMAHPWIHLDGLISHLVFRDALGELFWLLPARQPLPLRIPLPLEETAGVWHGSVSEFSSTTWSTTTVYKRFPTRDVAVLNRGKTKRINLASGRFRSWRITLPYTPTRSVVFHGCGDIEVIRELFRHVKHVGKKTAYGFGEIREVTIEQEDEDRSLVSDGVAMRPLPVRMLSLYDDKVMMACRPPYWAKESVEMCAPPRTVVEVVK